MPSRKRVRDEMEAEEPVEEPTTLHKLRNMWQFANLMQYISMFGDAIKFDSDFDIEDLETECLKLQPSDKLSQLGLALLKHVSSHKGLTPAIFDEYTRRQYEAKAPHQNPFGSEEEPGKFDDFDIFTKIRVLQQLSQWTLNNPNSIRERMVKQGDDQTEWRMEPLGWDAEDRVLYVLDDNRLYRRTDPPPPPPPKAKPKSKAKKKAKGTRSSKRQKLETPEPEDVPEEAEDTVMQDAGEPEDDGFGGMKWECLCITLEEYQSYINSLRRTRDENEKILRSRLENDVLPVIEKVAEEQAKKEARRQKEWENMQKLATAKRSSRISSRLEKQKEAEDAAETERKRQEDLALAEAEERKRQKLEDARESRMMTREQRLKERETKRILHEEELRRLQENSEKVEQHEARLSERHLKAEMKRRQEELEKLQEEEDDWLLDCEVCGMYGERLKDGKDIIACDKCTVWQHIGCHGISQAQADDENYQFICQSCKRKEAEAKQPKLPPLKLRLTSQSPMSSPRGPSHVNGVAPGGPASRLEAVSIPVQRPVPEAMPPAQHTQNWMNLGPSLSPRGQALGPPGIQRSEAAYGSPFNRVNGSSSPHAAPPTFARPTSSGQPGTVSFANGFATSSPPQYQSSRGAQATPQNGYSLQRPQPNGSPFSARQQFNPSQSLPHYNNSFNRPTSSAGIGAPLGSPVKHSPAPSPQPTNGYSNHPLINSPHSSFPQPSATPRPLYSPVKHSSPAPTVPSMSSPIPTPRIAPSPSQLPAQMLPHPIPAPEKHDGVRPMSSHSMSETPVLPPIKSLSPSAPTQILSPPTKKASPTPDRQQFAPVSGNGVGGTQQ